MPPPGKKILSGSPGFSRWTLRAKPSNNAAQRKGSHPPGRPNLNDLDENRLILSYTAVRW